MARISGKEEPHVHERLDEQTERELEEYAARAPEKDDRLMMEAFRNLLISRTLTPLHDEWAMTEFRTKSREKMKRLRASGVQEIPLEKRLRIIGRFLDEFTREAAQKSDPDVFRRYTRALRDIIKEFELDQSFFRGPIRVQILYLLIQQRYRFAFDYEQRLPVINDLEALTDITEAEELPTSQIKDYVFDALTKLYSQRPFGELESYLKEVFPLVTFSEQELDHLRVSLSQVISLLANEDNPSFPEQVRSLQWRKFIGELKPREKSEWVRNSVKAHGLFIDPQEAATSINTQSDCMYERELRDYCLKIKAATIKRRTEGGIVSKEVDPDQLPNRVLFAYLDGWPAVVEVLEKGTEPTSDKLVILRRLIHGVATEAFFPKIGSTIHPLQELFEAFERLSFSPEVKKSLVQEVYASYILRTSKVFDTASIDVPLPALEINHPAIQTARFRITKTYLSDPKNQVNIDDFAKGFYHIPALLSPAVWSENQFVMLSPFLAPARRSEVMKVRQSPKESQEESFNESLARRFKEYRASSKEEFESLSQIVIVYADRIRLFCASSDYFSRSYEEWLATQVGMGRYRLPHAERLPGREGVAWSRVGYEKMTNIALISNTWDVIDELYAKISKEQPWLKEDIDIEIKDRIGSHLQFPSDVGSQKWVLHVIRNYPELLREKQKESRFQWGMYHDFIGSLYHETGIDDILQIAPGVDLQDLRIQHAFARKALRPILATTGETPVAKEPPVSGADLERIDWTNPELRTLLGRSTIRPLISKFIRTGGVTDLNEEFRERIERMQYVTGYRVTDPAFIDFNGMSTLRPLKDALMEWHKLVDCFGEQAEEWDRIRTLAQERVDHICSRGHGKAEQYLELKRMYSLVPSKNALRQHLKYSILVSSDLENSMSLLHAFKVPIEFSPEELESLPPSSPRIEALIYSLLLPKKGAERVAAEKIYKARSPLAALIPQLLAIQSPTKRVEYCPYENGLKPLLLGMSISLKHEAENKGLLLFLKEFGLQNLPNLAMAVVELYESFHTTNPRGPSTILAELQEVLGVGKEKWTLEMYLMKIRALQHDIRQAILEDAPLDPRNESSHIGMEIFNALIPDTGQYRDVNDRASLLALTRTNKKELSVDPLFKPASKLVEVAEQESFSVNEEGSTSDRAVTLRRTQIEKKYKDETMQRFLGGWDASAKLLELEEGGKSRAYWFSLLHERWQKQIQVLTEKQEKDTHPKGEEARAKRIEALQQKEQRLTRFIARDQDQATLATSSEELLEELQSLFTNGAGKVDRVELEDQAGDVVRGLLLAVMRDHSPAHFESVKTARPEMVVEGGLVPEQIDAWERWFREEYLEHFAGLNPEVDVPLSHPTRLLMQKLWRIDGITEAILEKKRTSGESLVKHPLIDSFTLIQRLRREIDGLERNEGTTNKQPLQFWPVKGIGRVLAGDIANACYHTHRKDLAQGQYKKLTALLMTIPGHAELAGSSLLIDTKTKTGKRVLVIRALNPTEAVIRKSLSAEAIVKATIEYATDIAQASAGSKRPIQEVRLCFDHRGGHSTNREEVFQAENKLVQAHGWKTGEDLENVNETNFNNYNIHGASQTRVVWRAGE